MNSYRDRDKVKAFKEQDVPLKLMIVMKTIVNR